MQINQQTIRSFFKLTPATRMLMLAVIVGLLGGFGSLGFKKLILALQALFWATKDMAPETLLALAWQRRLLMPALGGLIVGPLIYFLAREARGPGVPEVMIAVITRNGIIRPIVVVVKAVASALSIASGGSVGREGPIVQIGAAIASTVGQMLRLGPVMLKTLVGCGVAAGIAATFNAPIAGTLFAMELIVADFGLTSFTPILVSAVAATALTRHFHGNITEFVLPAFSMKSHWEFGLYLILGILAGLIAYVFSRCVYISKDLFEKSRIPACVRPAAGGLLVGAMAIAFPHVMGVGYDTMRVLLEGELALGVMALLVFLKIVATASTVGSGGSGGVFAPSLFIGAMAGGTFGTVAHQWFPSVTASPAAYALVGMAAVNGACTQAPLSAIIVLFEMTGEYGIILPLMFAVVMATFVARKLYPESIYTEDLVRRGIAAHEGGDLNILRAIPVRDVLRHDEATIPQTASFDALVRLTLETRRNVIFAVDEAGRYRGAIAMQDLMDILNQPREVLLACDITDCMQELMPVLVTQTLDCVVGRFAETGFDRLPVVDNTDRLVGSVVAADIMRQYTREVTKRNIAIELGARIAAHDPSQVLHIGGDTVVAEMPVPEWMVGKRLGELALRAQHNVSVFVVKEHHGDHEPRLVTPTADYCFRAGDTLLVGGTEKDVTLLKKHA